MVANVHVLGGNPFHGVGLGQGETPASDVAIFQHCFANGAPDR
jgi:hypothetical protein